MKKYIDDFKLLRNKRLNPDNFLLELECPNELPQMYPGQFVQVKVENAPSVFLRRPFSIHDIDYERNTISLLIKTVGNGTKQLAYLEEGDYLNIVYPLGNSFSESANGDVLLVGGGCGVAPMLFLAKFLGSETVMPHILIGAQSKDALFEMDAYEEAGRVYLATNDGSAGEEGMVTDHSLFKDLKRFEKIYACGPEPMMKAVAARAKAAGVDCEVSLENLMACGIGACLCCVTDTAKGNVCTCTEGPVFNVNELKWQN